MAKLLDRYPRDGGDPVAERRRAKAEAAAATETFQGIAEEWIETRSGEWGPTYKEAIRSALNANLFSQIGGYPIRTITVPVMREALLVIERRGALSVLQKVRMWASQVFRFPMATGRADMEPAAPLRGTFKAHKPKNFAAVTKADEFGNVHDTAAAGLLLDRAAAGGWTPHCVKVDDICVGARMAQAAASHGIEVRVSTRERDVKSFKPLPVRWRIEGTFGTLTNRYHRLTRNLEQSASAAEDAVIIANFHRLIRAYNS